MDVARGLGRIVSVIDLAGAVLLVTRHRET